MLTLPDWPKVVVAIGGTGLISSVLAWLTGHRVASATARKFNAEAARLENDNRNEKLRVESSRIEFERTLNERATLVIENFEKQSRHLSNLVENQSSKITEQTLLMAKMEAKIVDLRKALESETNRER